MKNYRPKEPLHLEPIYPCEEQVANLVAQGLSNKAVAEHTGLKESTVHVYLTNYYRKMGLSDDPKLSPRALLIRNAALDSSRNLLRFLEQTHADIPSLVKLFRDTAGSGAT